MITNDAPHPLVDEPRSLPTLSTFVVSAMVLGAALLLVLSAGKPWLGAYAQHVICGPEFQVFNLCGRHTNTTLGFSFRAPIRPPVSWGDNDHPPTLIAVVGAVLLVSLTLIRSRIGARAFAALTVVVAGVSLAVMEIGSPSDWPWHSQLIKGSTMSYSIHVDAQTGFWLTTAAVVLVVVAAATDLLRPYVIRAIN